jgi:hypothetical protein
MGGLCGLGVLLDCFVGDSIPSSRPRPVVGDSSGFSWDVMTITGDEGIAEEGTGGTGGMESSFVDCDCDCDKRAFVFGAETTRRNHRVAADPFDGVSLSSKGRGDGGG